MNFDEYNVRLQEIIKKLENNDVSVEEGTKLYEEGVEIAKKCYEMLKTNKGKVVILKEELEKLSNFIDED
ncbi:MAG: exodeoxyribonuclease VII small subunit [Clostridia bacterium]|nr:exodeoxyribonuclease VII small subunit [Clostridia bacterium]